jgi:cytochrome c
VSRVKTVSICGAIAVVASLALARVHPFGDAGLYATKGAVTPIMEHSSVPPEIQAILAAKCADCHSMQTRAAIYGRFAPVSWLMERDIVNARKAMNLSQWEAYSPEQQQTLAAKIVHETKAHDMPPEQYRIIHWNTRMKDAEIRTLASWAHVSSGSSGSESNQRAEEGDPIRGKELFEKRCTGCHSLTRNRQGPRLQGVYGRTSGSVGDYAYSQALKNSHIVWDEKSLEQWLTDPDAFFPGNNMDFLVSNPQERLHIISYLKQGSGK